MLIRGGTSFLICTKSRPRDQGRDKQSTSSKTFKIRRIKLVFRCRVVIGALVAIDANDSRTCHYLKPTFAHRKQSDSSY